MKFNIVSTECWSNPQKLLEEYPCLSNYEFEVTESSELARTRIHDENGKPMWQPFTRIIRTPYIHVHTLEDLLKLTSDVDAPLIIDKSGEIEIYDGYRE